MKRYLLSLILAMAVLAPQAQALPMLMARSHFQAEVTMDMLQELLQNRGYAIAHVQRCDGGLTDFDYKTDYYQVVFYGKIDEVRKLTGRYPELIPYLPLKIAVFAEADESVLTAFNPLDLAEYFDDPTVHQQLQRWADDINDMFDEIRLAK